MKRKVLFAIILISIISLFSFTYTFAANGLVDGIRNTVGGAENVVKSTGSAIGNTIRNGMNTLENGGNQLGKDAQNTMGTMTGRNNDNYTATRTSTTTDTNNGMSTTPYTWVIIGITAVGIGVLIWSYIAQNNKNNDYIDSDIHR